VQSSLRNIMERGRAYKSPSEHWSVFCLLSSEFASRGRRGVFYMRFSRHDSSERLIGSQGFLPSIPIQQILTVLHQTFTFLFLLHAIIRRLCNVSVLTRDRHAWSSGMQGSTEVHAEVSSRRSNTNADVCTCAYVYSHMRTTGTTLVSLPLALRIVPSKMGRSTPTQSPGRTPAPHQKTRSVPHMRRSVTTA
jgi:hypothetical protein